MTLIQGHGCLLKDQVSVPPSIVSFIAPIFWAFFLINSEINELEKSPTQRSFALDSVPSSELSTTPFIRFYVAKYLRDDL